MELPSFTFFVKQTQSLNVRVMLSDSRLRKLRQHFVPSSVAIATAVFGHRLRQVKGKRQVFFLSGSCFSFNDL